MKASEVLKEIETLKGRIKGCEIEINNLNELIAQMLEMSGAVVEKRDMDS